MFGTGPEKQITVMLKVCVEFPKGHDFPCEEAEVDIEQGQIAHCGAEGVSVKASWARVNLRKRSRSGNGHGTKSGSLQKVICYELEFCLSRAGQKGPSLGKLSQSCLHGTNSP